MLVLFLLGSLCDFSVQARDFVLVIDAGHGGKDVGARGVKAYEKNITLAVARRLGEKVKKECKDVKVVYTRSDDSFVSLKDRADIANEAHGDLFVSIHVNSVAKKNKKRRTIAGAEVYTLGLHRSDDNLAVAMRENSVMSLEADHSEVYQGFDPESSESYIIFELSQSRHMDQSIEMAELVQQSLVSNANRVDKGVKQAGFWVL
ncbi:MAG: N-acetylmuramoyl-L-alanine amidase, partial [Muribaculaceae bacterium]|nr:N-acetylmuramoyl-L-alanine amidase [Muribaculaceae bacterium]